jgi:DNA-3-methyladenine glycosylase II
MNTITSESTAKQAADYLARVDPKLAPVIAAHGLCDIRSHRNYYRALTSEIIGQQLSVKAASSIRTRFEALFSESFPEPAAILQKSIDELRSSGLSRAKANYIRDLAQHIVDGKIQFDHLDNLTNEEVISELTDVKGIGEWTAHMFLMFCMGRADVLAPGDLGIRNAIKKLYNMKTVPTPEEVVARAKRNHWHPYETFACWYLWASLENKPQ